MSKNKSAKSAAALELNTVAAPLDMASFMEGLAGSAAQIETGAADLAAQEETAAREAAALAELAALEAATNPAEPEAGQASDEPATDISDIEPLDHVPGVLKELKGNFTVEQKTAKKDEIVSAFTERKDFEKAQPGLSSKMIPNLEAEEKKMATIGAAGLFLAMDIDPGFINREVSTGSRFNVYAFQKVNDLIVALDGGFMQNAINKAIVTSLFNFRDAGIPFTGTAALAAASDKVKADRAMTKHLVRHNVAAATASTQKSSTMTALKTLGIVTNSGTRGAEVWTLTDTPATRRLEEVVRGKIAA